MMQLIMHVKKTRQRAQKLREDIDSEFILATKFLANILFTFSNLTKIFQSDYVAPSDVHMQQLIQLQLNLLAVAKILMI